MKCVASGLLSLALFSTPAFAQTSVNGAGHQSDLGANFAGEASRFSESCGAFKVIPCATLLFTDHPLHIAAGSLAPGNGFAAGPAFVYEHHTRPRTPKNAKPGESGSRWRLNLNADGVVSGNGSWRAGVYMTSMLIPGHRIQVLTGPPPPNADLDLTRKSPVISTYVQTESLNKLVYYGVGQGSSRSAKTFFGMTETIAGVSVLWPVWRPLALSLFGEANARIVSLRGNHSEKAGLSIEQLYTDATAPGLADQPAFGQFGQGIRMEPSYLRNHVKLNYSFTLQEYVAPGSKSSFRRIVLDLAHEFPLYSTSTAPAHLPFNGPDSCSQDGTSADCPPPTRSSNRQGSFGIRFLLTDSYTSSGNTVPFYFQPTLGGSDINGQQFLASYADYRFRGPNLLLLRGSFEHSIWGPIGFKFLADTGRVATTRSDLGFEHLAHSFATGITLRAGGFPVVSLLFAWGGHEGTHTLAQVDSALLGGGGRPSLH
jgi:hypothetical protein